MATRSNPPLIFDGTTLFIPRASATQDGYVSAEDYAAITGQPLGVTSFNGRSGAVTLTLTDVTTAQGYTALNKAGGAMTGPLTLFRDPQSAMEAATKDYVDTHVTGGGAPRVAGEIYLSDYHASGSAATFIGTILASSLSTLTTTATTDFAVNQGIYIASAGPSGAPLITKVAAISGTTITLQNPASAAVTSVNVQHDETDAFQAALDAMGAAGVGRLHAGAGVFRVNKPPGTWNAILRFTYVPNSGTPPNGTQQFSIIGATPVGVGANPSKSCTIIQSDCTVPGSWILSAGPYQTSDMFQANIAFIYIEGVLFRTYANPTLSCLDLSQVWSVCLKQMGCDSGEGLSGTPPPRNGGIGIRLPLLNIPTLVYTEQVAVRGFSVGIIADELWHSQNCWIEHCDTGWQTHEVAGNYPAVGDLIIGGCRTSIDVKAGVCFDMHIEFEERVGEAAFAPIEGRHVYDPLNVATGVIRYYAYGTPTPGRKRISWTGCDGITFWSMDGHGIRWGAESSFELPPATDLRLRDLYVRGKTSIGDGSAEQPVLFGAADSGGAGKRQIIVANANALAAGVVSYWKFDETSGTRYDQVGSCNLRQPSYSTDALSAAGKFGNCLSGNAANYLTGPGSSALGGSFSVACWINFNAIQPWNAVFGFWPEDGVNNSFLLMHRTDTGQLEFRVSANGNTATAVGVALSPATGTWYHVAAVYDGSQIKISLNGAAFVAVAFAGSIHAPAALAALIYQAQQANLKIDELGLWNRALTIGEVGSLYNGGSGLTYPF